jgi:hypothetical protein
METRWTDIPISSLLQCVSPYNYLFQHHEIAVCGFIHLSPIHLLPTNHIPILSVYHIS